MIKYHIPSKYAKNFSYVLAEILMEERVKKFAEIGVWISKTTRKILRNKPPDLEEYWAVDPWVVMTGKYDGEMKLARELWNSCREALPNDEEWFKMYSYCCRLMTDFSELRVLKMTSRDAASLFPDGYFDMIFIDAIHTFHHVNADIGYWLPKVRKGGIISGHDYGHRRYIGVTEAVNKWFGEDIEVWKRPQVWIKRL